MACEQPRKIVNRRYVGMDRLDIVDYSRTYYGTLWPPDYVVEVPCGYCHSCQKSVNNQYRIRLMYECRRYPPGSCLFLTLTFDDEYLHKFSKDYNKAVLLFLDRLRKNYGKQIRHWFIGEFGTLKGRPHYHGILFDVPKEFIDAYDPDVKGHHPLLAKEWKYGFVFVGYVSDETCSYITKYVTKSINGDKIRPRVISSQGIGSNYLDTDDALLHKYNGNYQPFMHLNGYKCALPRYLYNKIFNEVDKQNLVVERFINPPPPTWQGVEYSFDYERDIARRSTYLSNTNIGLTSFSKLPTRRVKSSFDKFRDTMSEFDDNEFNDFEN